MNIHVDPASGLPVYQQIVNQIKYLVSSSALAAGAELPAIRVLAERLLINPNTVARAYRELETAGVVVKRGTAGTFVSDTPSPLARRERLRILRQRIDVLLADARHMGIGLDELLRLIEERDAAMSAMQRPRSKKVSLVR